LSPTQGQFRGQLFDASPPPPIHKRALNGSAMSGSSPHFEVSTIASNFTAPSSSAA
jgi:hypothetical protein